MKYFKLILFVIIAGIFVFSSYLLLFEIKSNVGDSIGVEVNFIVFVVALITGIITVIILFKSSKNYLYTFLIILSVPFFSILLDQINESKEQLQADKYHKWSNQLENQKIHIWENIDNPEKVEELLSETKEFKQHEYKIFRASVYFGLAKKDENYYSKYEQFIQKNNLKKCDVVEEILQFNIPNTEEDYLHIFKALGSPHKGLDHCIPIPYDKGIERKDFYFKTLYEKGYKKAALEALKEKIDRPSYHYYYTEQFKKIDDLEYRKTAFVTLIENTDFSSFKLKDFYKLILEQKQEKYFESFLKLFANKLSTFNFEKTEFVNQKEQAMFMELYQLLGNKHQFIKSFPNEYINRQILYQKETRGKPFIHFVQFFSQAVNLEHTHPIDALYFYIKHKNKLIYKGVSNKYGCVSFKSYNLKPTDIIEVSLDNMRYETQIGWQQLLPAWNTEDGAKARFFAMGYNPEYENIYQYYSDEKTTFTTEIAKKIKTDFDSFFDVKWQE